MTAESPTELNPEANSFMPLAAFDGTDFNSADVLAYIPSSESQCLSLERRPDGGVAVANTVNVLILDAPVVPAKNKAEAERFPLSDLNIVGIWRGVEYTNGTKQIPNVEGVITPENPYGHPPPNNDRQNNGAATTAQQQRRSNNGAATTAQQQRRSAQRHSSR